jgi:hypothetical protein
MVHRRRRARQVHQVFDIAHALHLSGLFHEVVDQLSTRNLSP